MKEFKGTKGEWRTTTNLSVNGEDIQIVNSKGTTKCIAKIERYGFGIDWLKEAEANAKLIAAAPELLEALQSVVLEMEDNLKHGAIYATLYKAKQAIKKAL